MADAMASWRDVCRTVKPIRVPAVRVTARAPRTPLHACLRIACLDTAYRVRRRLEATVCASRDPDVLVAGMLRMSGMCAIASRGLVFALAAEGFAADIVEGKYEVGGAQGRVAHCWVTVPGVFEVLDITASQFVRGHSAPLVVARQRIGGPYAAVSMGEAFYRECDRIEASAHCAALFPKAWDHLRWWEVRHA